MTNPLDEPLPLVTATFTTDELAAMSAGMILLRRHLGQTLMGYRVALPATAEEVARISVALDDATAAVQKLNELVTPEQGQALLKKLFKK